MTAIRARGLTYTYRSRRTVSTASPETGAIVIGPLDLTVAPGETVALLGPNGSGKSTLLRILSTALRPARGELVLLDLPGARLRRLRRTIGYAGDTAVHIDALSGLDNARFFGRAAGLTGGVARERALSLLDRLGLGKDHHRPVGAYSFGMRRRLLLAQALLHRPRLLLLDEPTLGLDPEGRDVIRALIEEHTAGGAAAVLASNDVAWTAGCCDRVLFLHRGAVVGGGSPGEIVGGLSGARLEIRIRADRPPVIELEGATIEESTTRRVSVRSPDGAALLPDLCDRLIRAGAEIRAVRVHEPDLAEAFRLLTGTELTGDAPGP